MFKAERIQRIKEIIFERKQVNVSTLSSLLNVTEVTIRNDLEQLEKSGFLTRWHGGATLNSDLYPEQSVPGGQAAFPDISFEKEKDEIGQIAAKLVEEREWIFLGPGTTSYYIAKALSKRQNLNIMTNNFYVSYVLGGNPSINLMFLGGKLDHSGMYTIPDDLQSQLKHIYLNKSFFSVDAVSLDGGYTLTDVTVLEIINTMKTHCSETILCVDSKKFGQRAFMKLGDLTFASTVITNSQIPQEYHEHYLKHGIRLFTSYDLELLI